MPGRLARGGQQPRIDEGSRLSLVFRRTDGAAISADAGTLHRLMSGFAIAYRLADEPAWQKVA